MMTRAERTALARLVRAREKVAKSATSQRRAELAADFEAQLARIYSPNDDATMKEIHEAARAAEQHAAAALAQRCAELGIPKRFAPTITMNWWGRGENFLAARRAELRKVATSRLDAMEKTARTEIERASVEVQTALVSDGLTTAAARDFLGAMPTAEALMPSFTAREIAGILPVNRSNAEEDPDA
jgi:hypothetical protein